MSNRSKVDEQIIPQTRQAISDATFFDEGDYNTNFDYDSRAYGLIEKNFMKQLSNSSYKSDKLYPSASRAVAAILERSLFVAPVDVLIETDRLDKKVYEDWRFGRIPYLEHVTKSGLGNLNRILRILQLHCQELGLKPSHTVYNRWGKGPKTRLRFSKSGDANLEGAYSTHWVALNASRQSTQNDRG